MFEVFEDKPNVFISYAWGDEYHQNWVKKFADILIDNGINVILDQYDIGLGDRIPHFMEQAVSKVDKVLIICTPEYKQKADKREGGVGYEEHIISSELMTGKESKFIPILKAGDERRSVPICLAGKKYYDLSNAENLSYSDVEELILVGIFDKKQKPPIGACPPKVGTFVRRENPDDIHIVEIIANEVTAPRNDGTPGCALYKVPFRLSKRPSSEWKEFFVNAWDRPPSFTSMHRPGIASVSVDKIVLDGTTLEEVQKYHKETLILCVDIANKLEKEYIQRENERKERAMREETERKQKVFEMANRITF